MILINLKSFFINFLIVLFSTLFSFIVLEFTYKIYKNKISNDGYFGTLIFQQSKVFKNIGNIFTYQNNIKNRRVKVITLEGNNKTNSIIEYDYSITTNNIGMVMKRNINHSDKVDLFLGDSFTEGQGAIPWFYKLEDDWTQKQKPLNAGLLGTGPAQWYELAKYLEDKYELQYDNIHIVMILTDLIRPIWNFKDQVIECIEYSRCTYAANFQGFNLNSNSHEEIIAHVDTLNDKYKKQPRSIDLKKSIYENFKSILKSSVIISDIYTFLRDRYAHIFPVVKKNLDALNKINKISKKNITITLINKRGEKIDQKHKFSNLRIYNILKNWAIENNLLLNICNFELEDFHKYDAHLNELGYDKLFSCVQSHISNS